MENDKKVIKKYSPKETKDILLQSTKFEGDLDYILSQLGNDLLPKYFDGSDEESKEVKDQVHKKTSQMLIALETDTHIGLMDTFDSYYKGLSKELCSQLIKEYQCNTNLEKTLVEVIVNSFIRIIDNSRRLNNELDCKNITPNRNVYISILSKQVDRANRQYLNALMALKQLKTPNIEMNIKTNTAFISHNQQINTGTPLRKDENKINEAE